MPATQRKNLSRKNSAVAGDASWLRRFWTVLVLIGLCGMAAIYVQTRQAADNEEEDAYLSLPIRTSVGDNQLLIGKVSLLIDPEQEKGLERRKSQLEAVITASLADSYQGPGRPLLSVVQKDLMTAINAYLPRKLRVRDVLIQDLVVGIS